MEENMMVNEVEETEVVENTGLGSTAAMAIGALGVVAVGAIGYGAKKLWGKWKKRKAGEMTDVDPSDEAWWDSEIEENSEN